MVRRQRIRKRPMALARIHRKIPARSCQILLFLLRHKMAADFQGIKPRVLKCILPVDRRPLEKAEIKDNMMPQKRQLPAECQKFRQNCIQHRRILQIIVTDSRQLPDARIQFPLRVDNVEYVCTTVPSSTRAAPISMIRSVLGFNPVVSRSIAI